LLESFTKKPAVFGGQEESCPDDDFDPIRMSTLKVQLWNFSNVVRT
jgi:hypothetical protein